MRIILEGQCSVPQEDECHFDPISDMSHALTSRMLDSDKSSRETDLGWFIALNPLWSNNRDRLSSGFPQDTCVRCRSGFAVCGATEHLSNSKNHSVVPGPASLLAVLYLVWSLLAGTEGPERSFCPSFSMKLSIFGGLNGRHPIA